MQCINCGRNLFGHERFCPDCGTPADAGATQAPGAGTSNPGTETRISSPGEQTMVAGDPGQQTMVANTGAYPSYGGPACPWCGAATIPGLRFCENCGGSLMRESVLANAAASGGSKGFLGNRWLGIGGIIAAAAAAALIGGWCVVFGGGDDDAQAEPGGETATASPSGEADESPSASPGGSPSPRPSPSVTPSPSPSATPSPSPSATPSPSPSPDGSPSRSPTATNTATNTPTATRTGTATNTATNTNTATATRTNTPTATPTRTNTPTATPTNTTQPFSIDAYFSPSTYEAGQTATLCWDVSSSSTTYSFTVSEVSPGNGQIDSGSGQVGGQCRNYPINEGASGTITVEVVLTTSAGTRVTDRASMTVTAAAHLGSVSASLDSAHYVVGDIAQFCWQVSPSGIAHNYEVYVATFFYDSGSDTSGPLRCVNVEIIYEDAQAGSITVEIFILRGSEQVSASATAQVSFSG